MAEGMQDNIVDIHYVIQRICKGYADIQCVIQRICRDMQGGMQNVQIFIVLYRDMQGGMQPIHKVLKKYAEIYM